MPSAPYQFYIPEIAPPGQFPAGLPDPDDVDFQDAVVVRATNWLGDTMMTLPAVYKLRSLMPPECRLVVLCPSFLEPIWAAADWVDEVLAFPGKRVHGQVADELRNLEAGVAVVLPNSFGAAWDVCWKKIPMRIGRNGRGRAMLLTDTIPAWQPDHRNARFHQLSGYLDIVQTLGEISRDAVCPPLTVDEELDDLNPTLATLLHPVPAAAPRLILAPGAAFGPAKQWPVDNYAHIAKWWTAKHGQTIVVGTAGETPLGETIAKHAAGTINLCGHTSLAELLALLKTATACVANDSGTMHLAAGLGCRGIALFGATNPHATGPLGGKWLVLQKERPCAPCFKRQCQSSNDSVSQCLAAITPDEVADALEFIVRTEG